MLNAYSYDYEHNLVHMKKFTSGLNVSLPKGKNAN